MCGIVGYFGSENPKDIIIQGLKKLEYRGYDSAGISILHKGQLKRIRAEGKLTNLEEKLVNETFDGSIGIGHTRWATHGAPVERNAHPHQVGDIALVHNGIIENYLEIRSQLLASGADITSDTDSELVAHLISLEIEKTKDLKAAVFNVLPKLTGAFSILVLWQKKPDELIAFKDGPPLIVGIGKNETLIVSDVAAAVNRTKEFIYLEDREVVFVKNNQVKIFSKDQRQLDKKSVLINWTQGQMEKKGFAHYMLKEIHEQPNAIASVLSEYVDTKNLIPLIGKAGFDKNPNLNLTAEDFAYTNAIFSKVKRIQIVSCGTSFYAAMIGKYLFEKIANISCEVDIASEYRYRNPIVEPETLVITISQSGETADTLAALRYAKEQGAKVLSICNVKNSTIDREAHGHLYMQAWPEVAVASTKAFTCTITILNILSLGLAELKDRITKQDLQKNIQELQKLPQLIEATLTYDKYFHEASDVLKKFKGFLYLGRGVNFPIALEGALKLKELAYLHAEGYAAGEMKHGPLALIDNNMAIIVVAPDDDLLEKTISNLEEAKARGGRIISIGTANNERLKQVSERYLALPKTLWNTNCILSAVPLQLMAYHLAVNLGHDVDQPRNLAKSVTVE